MEARKREEGREKTSTFQFFLLRWWVKEGEEEGGGDWERKKKNTLAKTYGICLPTSRRRP